MFNVWLCLSMCDSFVVDLSCLGSSCCCIMKIVYSPTWDHKGRELEQQMVYIVKEHLKHERQLLRERQNERWKDWEKWEIERSGLFFDGEVEGLGEVGEALMGFVEG